MQYSLESSPAQIRIETSLQRQVFSGQERNVRIGPLFRRGQNVAWAYPHDLGGFGVSIMVAAKFGISNSQIEVCPKKVWGPSDRALEVWKRLLIMPHQHVRTSGYARIEIMTGGIELHCVLDGAEGLGRFSETVQRDCKKSVCHAAIGVDTNRARSLGHRSIKPPLKLIIVGKEREGSAIGVIQNECFLRQLDLTFDICPIACPLKVCVEEVSPSQTAVRVGKLRI